MRLNIMLDSWHSDKDSTRAVVVVDPAQGVRFDFGCGPWVAYPVSDRVAARLRRLVCVSDTCQCGSTGATLGCYIPGAAVEGDLWYVCAPAKPATEEEG